MKKYLACLLAVVCLILMFSGCKDDEILNTNPEGSTCASLESSLPKYQPGSVELQSQENDDYDFERKYRITYYRIWGEFIALLDEEQMQDFYEWREEDSKQNDYGASRNEMLLAAFVKRYNIPREEFDKAVEAFVVSKNIAKYEIVPEEYEVPNGDIIYTFDNEIINEYYRYA